MADFEDANSPTWDNMIDGQINLKDRWAATIDFTDAASGKAYKLGDKPAVLLVRPRGWHLPRSMSTVDGAPMSGSLFDFGLYFFHNAKAHARRGQRALFLSAEDRKPSRGAALERGVRPRPEQRSALPPGTIKATVLIETLPAAFEMDEILYEMRDHIAGLNCGRWDYIFSFIKTARKEQALPDAGPRARWRWARRSCSAYSLLLIKTCHRRGAFAMGGMAAQIPVEERPGRQRGRLRQGPRRQGARGRRRP